MKYVYLLLTLTGLTSQLYCMDENNKASDLISKLTLPLLVLKQAVPQRETTYAERRKYGFNGTIIPIYQQTFPTSVKPVGCIIKNAQPSMFFGYWYADTHVFTHRICLENKQALIKDRQDDMEIDSSFLLDENKIAIMWRDNSGKYQQKLHITLSEVIKDAEIDLDNNKFEVVD